MTAATASGAGAGGGGGDGLAAAATTGRGATSGGTDMEVDTPRPPATSLGRYCTPPAGGLATRAAGAAAPPAASTFKVLVERVGRGHGRRK